MFSLKVLLLISIASVAWCVPADEKNEKPAEAPKEQKDAGKPVGKI